MAECRRDRTSVLFTPPYRSRFEGLEMLILVFFDQVKLLNQILVSHGYEKNLMIDSCGTYETRMVNVKLKLMFVVRVPYLRIEKPEPL